MARIELRKGALVPEHSHANEQISTIERGRAKFVLDGVEHTLAAGDCIHWKSTVPHLVRNDGVAPAEVVWVLTPRLF